MEKLQKLKLYNEFINEAVFDVETELMNWVKGGEASEDGGTVVPDTIKTFIESKIKGNVIDLGGAKKYMIYFTEKGDYVDHYFVKSKGEELASIVAFLVSDKFQLTNDDLGGDLMNCLEPRRMEYKCLDITLDANYL